MRRIVVALIFLFAITPAFAQFAESTLPPCQGCSAEEIIARNRTAHPLPQAIGGAVGSPTFVMPAQKGGGVIQIGAAFGDFLQPYIDAAVQALLAALVGWVCLRIQKR